jgi:uncharacterized iron-regulated protein
VKLAGALTCTAVIAGCSTGLLLQDHPLTGSVWDVRAGAFVAPEQALERAALPPASCELREALERDLIEGHCGQRLEAKRLAGMVEAQRARDALMAQRLASHAGGGVLIAGIGHARKDRGVPLYLAGDDLLSIDFVEVEAGKDVPGDYLGGFATAASFDYLWFTPRNTRADPCARSP